MAHNVDEFQEQHDKLGAGVCPAPGCQRNIRFGRLACPEHWSALPITLRRLITRAWDGEMDNAFREHARWKVEAFRFWTTGTWADPR